MTTFDRLYFEGVCAAAVRDVRAAAHHANDGEWCDPVARAVDIAQKAMRDARRLGLIPTTAALELEARRAA